MGTLTVVQPQVFPGRLLAHSGFRRFMQNGLFGLFVQYQQADATVAASSGPRSLKRIVAAMPTTRTLCRYPTLRPSVRGGMHWPDGRKLPVAISFLTAGVGEIIV